MHHTARLRLSASALLCLCAVITASPTPTSAPSAAAYPKLDLDALNATENFNCPEDCKCAIAPNTHIPFLHAKCSSIEGLKSDEPLRATLPVHSVDLSYLNLPRLSHALEKLIDLTSVDLSHNELHEIGHLGRRIKKLNLKHNRLTSNKLTKLPQHVQMLNLQHNDITYLPKNFTHLTHLQTLELSHNEINCSCETLEVRNWLQERNVFMEHAVVCSYPVEVKGKPWLQVRQSDICARELRGRSVEEEENELMMGDQPVEGSGDADDEDELGKAYMPLDTNKSGSGKSTELQLDDIEGSGDLSLMNLPLNLGTTDSPLVAELAEGTTEMPFAEEEEDEDGSGSGGGLLILPNLARLPMTDDFEEQEEKHDSDDGYDNRPIEEPTHEDTQIFGNGMGIFDDKDKDGAKTGAPVIEEEIIPAVHHNVEAEGPTGEQGEDVITDSPAAAESDSLERAKVGTPEDSNATYFLLGVIALIVVGLILFVGIKRCKNKRGAHDAENPRQTELLDMDKKNLGKPLHTNGGEHSPLIGEKSKADMAKPVNGKKPYDSQDVKDAPGQQQPLLNGNGTTNGGSAPNESNNNVDENITKSQAPSANEQAPHQYHPITPRYPTPKSPRASKYAQYPQGEHNNNNNVDDSYLPSSPKSGRYSPVYSPETGRVKIKLTETPRPKTPMLVTRSKSNAGEIITTPVAQNNMPAVHVGGTTVNGH